MRELAIAMLRIQCCDINRVAYRLLLKIREQNVDSKGLLDQHAIVSAMERAATMTTEEIEEEYADRLSFLRKCSVLKSGIIIRKNKQNKICGYSTLLSQVKKELVLSVVSGQESPQEALAIVEKNDKTNRFGITLNWIQKLYCEKGFCAEKKMIDLGIQLNAIREVLKENPDIAQRPLLKKLQEKGVKISRATLQNRLKELPKLTT
nr:MAG TPA: arginine repressor [Caudoviricetes sp.]